MSEIGETLPEIFRALRPDPDRGSRGFSPDLDGATRDLLSVSPEDRASILASWLKTEQPCIFGRLAAERELISYCFLAEADLLTSDEHVASIIQKARRAWKDQALHGQKSAFVILAFGKTLYEASPDEHLMRLSLRICELYLRRKARPDVIMNDWLELWDLTYESRRRWLVGVNVFAAAGDRRWWHDHRIPGGVAFSMNSVGHLVAAEARRLAVRAAAERTAGSTASGRTLLRREAEARLAELQQSNIRTLGQALKFALHTIAGASTNAEPQGWQAATTLLRREPGTNAIKVPEIQGDSRLSDCNTNSYAGWYHTDITVPCEYFRPDWQRPDDIRPFLLDLSYLHRQRSADFRRISEGVPQRERVSARRPKRGRGKGVLS